MDELFAAVDAISATKWSINARMMDVVTTLWARGGGVAGLVSRRDVPIPAAPPRRPKGYVFESEEAEAEWGAAMRRHKKELAHCEKTNR